MYLMHILTVKHSDQENYSPNFNKVRYHDSIIEILIFKCTNNPIIQGFSFKIV